MNSIELLVTERKAEVQAFLVAWKEACKGQDLTSMEVLSGLKYAKSQQWKVAASKFEELIAGVYMLETMGATLFGRILTAMTRAVHSGVIPYVTRKTYGAPRWSVKAKSQAKMVGVTRAMHVTIKRGDEIVWQGDVDTEDSKEIQATFSPVIEPMELEAAESIEFET